MNRRAVDSRWHIHGGLSKRDTARRCEAKRLHLRSAACWGIRRGEKIAVYTRAHQIREIKDKCPVLSIGRSIKSPSSTQARKKRWGRRFLGRNAARAPAAQSQRELIALGMGKRELRQKRRRVVRAGGDPVNRIGIKSPIVCRTVLQRGIGEPDKAAIAPVIAPGICNLESPLFSGIHDAVAIDVRPDMIIIANHCHRMAAGIVSNCTADLLADQIIIRRSRQVIGKCRHVPRVNVRAKKKQISICKEAPGIF